MGNSYGTGNRLFTENWGRTIQLTADGAPKFKAGGVTFDWTTVPAAVADVVVEENVEILAGQKYLPVGAVIYKLGGGTFGLATAATTLVIGETFLVNEAVLEEDPNSNHPPAIEGGRVFRDRIKAGGAAASEVQTLTVTATGGTFEVIFTYNGVTRASGAQAFNVTAANLQTALRAMSNIGAGNVNVTLAGGVYTITFAGALANTDVPALLVDDSLATGGTVTQATLTQGSPGQPTLAAVRTAIPNLTYAYN